MMRLLLSTLSTMASRYVGRLQGDHSGDDMDHLRLSLLYVKGVKSLRMMALALAVMGLGLALLVMGILLLVITILCFSTLSMEGKMYTGLACASVLVIASVVIFRNIFAQARWLDMFHVKDLVGRQEQHGGA